MVSDVLFLHALFVVLFMSFQCSRLRNTSPLGPISPTLEQYSALHVVVEITNSNLLACYREPQTGITTRALSRALFNLTTTAGATAGGSPYRYSSTQIDLIQYLVELFKTDLWSMVVYR